MRVRFFMVMASCVVSGPSELRTERHGRIHAVTHDRLDTNVNLRDRPPKTERTRALRSLKQELDFHRVEREDDPPIFSTVDHPGVQEARDITVHGFDVASPARRAF